MRTTIYTSRTLLRAAQRDFTDSMHFRLSHPQSPVDVVLRGEYLLWYFCLRVTSACSFRLVCSVSAFVLSVIGFYAYIPFSRVSTRRAGRLSDCYAIFLAAHR